MRMSLKRMVLPLLAVAGLAALPASSTAKAAGVVTPTCSLAVVNNEIVATVTAAPDTRFGFAFYAEPGGTQTMSSVLNVHHSGVQSVNIGIFSSYVANYPAATSFEFVLYGYKGDGPNWSDPLASCSISSS